MVKVAVLPVNTNQASGASWQFTAFDLLILAAQLRKLTLQDAWNNEP